MIYFAWFFMATVFVVIGSRLYYGKSINPKEVLAHFGAGVVAALLGTMITVLSMWSGTLETNLLHGKITGKEKQYTSCEHQYKCGESCSSDSKGNRTCTPIYCDEHTNDWDWVVRSSVGNFTIDRIDRRGSREPPRWTKVLVGEPATLTTTTNNFLKAMEDTVLLPPKSEIISSVKEPSTFDYYRVSLVDNNSKVSVQGFNEYLREWLKENGAKKQVAPWVIVTDYPTEAYADSVLYQVKGGDKNALIMIYGVDADGKVNWFRAHTFAMGMNNAVLITQLRQAALGDVLNLDMLKTQMALVDKHFVRVSNKEFKDLFDSSVKANPWVIFVLVVLQIVGMAFIGRKFHQEEMF